MGGHAFHHLGSLELGLRLDYANVNLRLSSEIKLATIREDGSDGASLDSSPVEHLLDGDGCRRPWVVKGHGYQLVVDLNVEATLELEDEVVAQQVAAQLKHSKARNVTAIEMRPSDCQVTSWILSLEYNGHVDPSAKPKPHKLLPDLLYHDTKPPPGVTVAKIEVVHLNMLLTPTLDASTRGSVASNSLSHSLDGDLDTEMLFTANDALDEAWSSFLFDDPADVECNDSQTYPIAQQDHRINSYIGTQYNELQVPHTPTPQKWCPYLTPPSSQEILERSHIEPKSAALQTQRISTRDVLQVIETGFKYATLKSPTRNVKSATVKSNEAFKSLASIAPALWVPDYHHSVSSRAVLIPTISHSIANVSSRASTNLGLGEKVRQLARQQSCRSDQPVLINARARANESLKTLSVQIWQIMTSSLSSTATHRKLQPFSDVAEPNGHTDAIVDDMLDEAATNQESCNASDFEDLYDIPGEPDGEAAGEMEDLSELGSMRPGWRSELEDHFVDDWGSGVFSPSILEYDMLGEDLEPEKKQLIGAVESIGGSNFVNCHQEILSWDGLNLTPASIISEFEEIEDVGFDAEGSLLEPCS